MEEKELEIELDIQHVKIAISKFATYYNDTKVKLKRFDEKYNARKAFIISQFKNMFFNSRWR